MYVTGNQSAFSVKAERLQSMFCDGSWLRLGLDVVKTWAGCG